MCFQGNPITEPSYSNESYDSLSRKPLDGFQNALHNKHIFIFGEGLITNMSPDITIYSTLLINLFLLLNLPFYFCIELRVAAEPQESRKGSMGEKSYPS